MKPHFSTHGAAAGRTGSAGVPKLAVRDVTVRFSGLTVLDEVSFDVSPGSIHAVIGPNGAGKSTCFNVLSGVYRVTSGSVRLGSAELTTLPPHRIAALGVARTFQNIVLTAGTVAENLMLGRHVLTRAGFVTTALSLPSTVREQRRHRDRARDIAEFVELGDHFDAPVGLLSYGDRKRVEMARALCMEPKVLLLDEPVAGMNATERLRMSATIVAVRDALDLTVLIVEHDMGMIMKIADEVTVLDFGRRIGGGTPEQVQRDPEVIRAYLGTGHDDAQHEQMWAAHHEAASGVSGVGSSGDRGAQRGMPPGRSAGADAAPTTAVRPAGRDEQEK